MHLGFFAQHIDQKINTELHMHTFQIKGDEQKCLCFTPLCHFYPTFVFVLTSQKLSGEVILQDPCFLI